MATLVLKQAFYYKVFKARIFLLCYISLKLSSEACLPYNYIMEQNLSGVTMCVDVTMCVGAGGCGAGGLELGSEGPVWQSSQGERHDIDL